jgi:hypothetical protein
MNGPRGTNAARVTLILGIGFDHRHQIPDGAGSLLPVRRRLCIAAFATQAVKHVARCVTRE